MNTHAHMLAKSVVTYYADIFHTLLHVRRHADPHAHAAVAHAHASTCGPTAIQVQAACRWRPIRALAAALPATRRPPNCSIHVPFHYSILPPSAAQAWLCTCARLPPAPYEHHRLPRSPTLTPTAAGRCNRAAAPAPLRGHILFHLHPRVLHLRPGLPVPARRVHRQRAALWERALVQRPDRLHHRCARLRPFAVRRRRRGLPHHFCMQMHKPCV